MHYRRLGRTNLEVSELSLGAARGATDDKQQFIEMARAAVDAGINFVDTAADYEDGDCETALGEALEGRDQVIIQTKYRPYDGWGGDAAYTGSPGALSESVERSLTRLRRDRIDILLGHGIRTLATLDQFMSDGCYDAMVSLRDQGKVRYLGLSELSEADGRHSVLRQAVPSGAFDVVMLTINLLLQTAVDGVLPLCAERDVGTVVMMPLNQASKTSGLVSMPAALELVRHHVAAGTLSDESPYTDSNLFEFLQPYGIPEAALRFVLAQDVSTCCVGMRTPERLSQNLHALQRPYLPDAAVSRVVELFGKIDTQLR